MKDIVRKAWNMETGHLFCFGLGYSAGFLARALRLRRWRVAGSSRDGTLEPALDHLDLTVKRFDGEHAMADFAELAGSADHLLISIPPGEAGDPVLRCHWDDLKAMSGLKWVGYLSTTGVYGDHGGDWVDEQTPPGPLSRRSERRVEAEQGWLRLWREHGLPVHVFRLAGIYGPGRNCLLSLRAGTAKRTVKPGQVFSRIHVEDLTLVLLQSMAAPLPGSVYNVADDEAAPPQDVVAYGAELLGLSPPPEIPIEDAGLSPLALSFYGENKRVRNDRIKQELGVRLRYPTYREGLRALIK